MNCGYFWVFWRIFFGYTGIPLPPPSPPMADPEGYQNEPKTTGLQFQCADDSATR